MKIIIILIILLLSNEILAQSNTSSSALGIHSKTNDTQLKADCLCYWQGASYSCGACAFNHRCCHGQWKQCTGYPQCNCRC